MDVSPKVPGGSYIYFKMGKLKYLPGASRYIGVPKYLKDCYTCDEPFMGTQTRTRCTNCVEKKIFPPGPSLERKCPSCETVFLRDVGKNMIYCYKCRPPHDGMSAREHRRYLVRLRDRFTCQDCKKVRTPEEVNDYNEKIEGLKGKMKSFDVHHLRGICGKKSRAVDAIADLQDMITLCHSCHFKRHDFSKRLDKSWN